MFISEASTHSFSKPYLKSSSAVALGIFAEYGCSASRMKPSFSATRWLWRLLNPKQDSSILRKPQFFQSQVNRGTRRFGYINLDPNSLDARYSQFPAHHLSWRWLKPIEPMTISVPSGQQFHSPLEDCFYFAQEGYVLDNRSHLPVLTGRSPAGWGNFWTTDRSQKLLRISQSLENLGKKYDRCRLPR